MVTDGRLGVALVGLGGYSRGSLAPALRLTEHCRLTGVVTGSPDKGRAWAADHGFSEDSIYDYGSMARMGEDSAIDIAYVATPNALHVEHAIAAARAGKHVICEKPMANTVAECDAILDACRTAGVRLSIGYRLHFEPCHEELGRLVRAGELGPFTRMSGDFSFVMTRPQWRAERALAGGGPLMDLGVYVIQETLMATSAAPLAVTARELPKARPEFFRDVEEGIEWTIEFADGSRATGSASYNDEGNHFRAEGDGGWFEIEPAYSSRGVRATTSQGPVVVEPAASQQALQIDDFAACVLAGRESRVPGEMGRRDMVLIEAIYASAAAGGRRIEVTV
jgi:glucose-fructose oxidoreductase